MATIKTGTLIFRIDRGLKRALSSDTQQELGSVANRVEVLKLNCCDRIGINILEQQFLFKEEEK